MAFEEAFEIEILNDVFEDFGSPSELVDRLERILSISGPTTRQKLCSGSSQKNNSDPNCRRARREHGGLNKLPPSFAKYPGDGASNP